MDEQELQAVVAARKELGPEHEEHLVAGFLDRMEKEIDRRVDERLAQVRRPRPSALHPGNLGVCIPIVAIAGALGHTAGLVVAFLALVIVFGLSELRR
ncbi:MAG TPA: hypothetical protein VI408_08010 [Gaiellaceae bacterium]